MSRFLKAPEIAPAYGGLDDEYYADGRASPTHKLRTLYRSGNLLASRGELMFRWTGSVRTTEQEDFGALVHSVPPFWTALLPVVDFPVPKKPGLTKMRIRVRAEITNLKTVVLQVSTLARPFTSNPTANVLTMVGTGAQALYESQIFEVQSFEGEALTFLIRSVVEFADDTDLSTITFGGAASGTITGGDRGAFSDTALVTPWRVTPPLVEEGGHYVFFSKSGNVLYGPHIITGTDLTVHPGERLYFWPGIDASAGSYGLGGNILTYNIKVLPNLRLQSVACYSVDRAE